MSGTVFPPSRPGPLWWQTLWGRLALSYLVPVILSLLLLALELERSHRLLSLLTVLVASIAGAIWQARILSAPLDRIQAATARIAEGDLSSRVDTLSVHELSELGRSINHMAEQLSHRMRELEVERIRTRKLLASLPDPVLTFNSDGELTYLNSAAQGALQVERKDAVGRKLAEGWAMLGSPQSTPTAHEIVLPLLEPGRRLLNLAEAVAEKGVGTVRLGLERSYRAYILPYEEDSRPGRLLVLRDMTDMKRLEEVRTLFLGAISHELRTPLTIIKGFAVTLLDHPELLAHEDVLRPLRRIDRETDRLTRLVNDLLDLTKIHSEKLSLDLQPVQPDDVVEDVVGLLNAHAERQGVKLKYLRDPESLPLPADRDRLKQVVINIVDNAIKFSPSGGSVEIRTSQAEDCWRLTVADTGPGVSEQDLPHLFDHFFRSQDVRKVGGTGLGLAIVREIVTMHRGEVWAESQPGQGTSVIVTLPSPPEAR